MRDLDQEIIRFNNEQNFKDDDFYRTLSPINSFLVWPKDIKLEKKFISSTFGNHSIFDWMTSKKCRIICLGDISDTQIGWIGAHHSEQICKVPYRYYKKFSGKIIDQGTCKELIKKHGRNNLEETFLKLARSEDEL